MQDLVARLAHHNDHLPAEALRQALADWPAAARLLYAEIERFLADPGTPAEIADVVLFTLFLAAEKRDPVAFALACRLGAETEAVDAVFGDDGAQHLARILVSTYGGDLRPLRRLLDDAEADEYAQAAGFEALAWLAAAGRIAREEAETWLHDAYEARRFPDGSFAWYGWQHAVSLLALQALVPLVEQAFAQERISAEIMDYEDFLADLPDPTVTDAERLARIEQDEIRPIDDAVADLATWHCFTEEFRREKAAGLYDPPPAPVTNPFRHVGRNDPCPCGSGKKFKKCCLGA